MSDYRGLHIPGVPDVGCPEREVVCAVDQGCTLTSGKAARGGAQGSGCEGHNIYWRQPKHPEQGCVWRVRHRPSKDDELPSVFTSSLRPTAERFPTNVTRYCGAIVERLSTGEVWSAEGASGGHSSYHQLQF